MSDFFQNGNVSTLHNLTRRPVEEIEAELATLRQFAADWLGFTGAYIPS